MNALKYFLLVIPLFTISSAFALGDYSTPEDAKSSVTTDTGTFPVEDQLKMQSEQERQEEEAELDSFGEDKYNRNIDPDVSDDIEKQDQ